MRFRITDTNVDQDTGKWKALSNDEAKAMFEDVYNAGLEEGRKLAMFNRTPTGNEFNESDILKTL